MPGTVVTLPSGRKYQLTGAVGGATPRPAIVGLTFSAHSGTWLNDAAWVTGNPATTGWHQHALAHDYTLILAEPVNGAWNVGKGVNDPNLNGWPGSGMDDVGFVLDAVSDAATRTPIDPARQFAAGGSAGGALAARLTVEHPDVFAAAAMASGWIPYRYPAMTLDCRADHGSADTTVPLRGGPGADGYVFPALYELTVRAPRGSRVGVYVIPNGGHGVPGWWANAIWTFFTTERSRP